MSVPGASIKAVVGRSKNLKIKSLNNFSVTAPTAPPGKMLLLHKTLYVRPVCAGEARVSLGGKQLNEGFNMRAGLDLYKWVFHSLFHRSHCDMSQ